MQKVLKSRREYAGKNPALQKPSVSVLNAELVALGWKHLNGATDLMDQEALLPMETSPMPCSPLPVLRIAPGRASSDERKELQEQCEELQERNKALEAEVHRLKMHINGMKEAFVDIAKKAEEWQDEKPL